MSVKVSEQSQAGRVQLGRSRWSARAGVVLAWVLVLLTVGGLCSSAEAAKKKVSTSKTAGFVEKVKGWQGFPWLIGGVLSAGVVIVALKGSKRSLYYDQ